MFSWLSLVYNQPSPNCSTECPRRSTGRPNRLHDQGRSHTRAAGLPRPTQQAEATRRKVSTYLQIILTKYYHSNVDCEGQEQSAD